jgi:hypothetical protein
LIYEPDCGFSLRDHIVFLSLNKADLPPEDELVVALVGRSVAILSNAHEPRRPKQDKPTSHTSIPID